jgi:hypothetical protein
MVNRVIANDYANGVEETCQDWINGTQDEVLNALRGTCMLLSVESKIDPKTDETIFNPKALERFNKNWPENAGIHEVYFRKLLQKALNNPRDAKSRKRFDDAAHMREARKNLEAGRHCWPIITEEEKRNCRMVAEIVVIATAVLLRSIEDQHGRHEKSLNGMPIDTNKLPNSKDIWRFAQGENFSVIEGYDIDKMVSALEIINAANRIAREVVADNHLVAAAMRAGIPPR